MANHLAYGLFEFEYQNDLNLLENKNNKDDVDCDEDHGKKYLKKSYSIQVGKKLVNMASPLKEEWYCDDTYNKMQIYTLPIVDKLIVLSSRKSTLDRAPNFRAYFFYLPEEEWYRDNIITCIANVPKIPIILQKDK